MQKKTFISGLTLTVAMYLFTGCTTSELNNPLSDDSGNMDSKVRAGYVLIDGDMLISEENVKKLTSQTKVLSKTTANLDLNAWRWSNGVIPFVISTNNSTLISLINSAITAWNSNTGIQLIPQNSAWAWHSDYIDFVESTVCQSYVGRINGRQQIWLSTSCADNGGVIHEIGHAVGLLHEHQRNDRTTFITLSGNLVTDDPVNWATEGNTFGNYDLSSVMHYSAGTYSYNKDGNAINGSLTAKNGYAINPSSNLTFLDIEGVRRFYPSTHNISTSFYFAYWEDLRAAFGNDEAAAARHYRQHGISEGRTGAPAFEVNEYIALNSDLSSMNFVQATEHYNGYGIAEERYYSVCFHPGFYLSSYNDLRNAFGARGYGDAARHFAEHGLSEGRKSSPVFDVQYYMQQNADLRAVYGSTNYQAGLIHFRSHGLSEGRVASPTFNVKNYLNRYADLRAAYGATNYREATIHWLRYGIAEGRIGT